MARIAGVDIPRDKRVVVSLTYIYGIGRPTAEKILAKTGISEDIRVKDLSDDQVNAIRQEVDQIKTEGDLRREVALNIKRLMEIGCYRGIRHRNGLPVRGQRTKTNARTRKGPSRTVANKKKYDDLGGSKHGKKYESRGTQTSRPQEYCTRMRSYSFNIQQHYRYYY